jgi:hypothetical protein
VILMKRLNRLRHAAALLTLAAAATLGGCSNSSNTLTLASTDNLHQFHQSFKQAYATINANGDYDVCLVHDANDDALADAGTGPVNPQVVTPRQLVHIRIYWKALSGMKPDHPASTNASIRWYLFGDRPDEAADLLEYSGSGLVMLTDNGTSATLDVRAAFLKPVMRRGDMADPMGPSTITGVVTAQVDPGRVAGLLAEARAATDNSGANLGMVSVSQANISASPAARLDMTASAAH